MRFFRLISIAMLVLAAGCAPANLPPPGPPAQTTLTVPPPETPAPVTKAVAVSLGEASSASYAPEIDFGSTSRIRLSLEPELLAVTFNPDGSIHSSSTRPWTDAPPLEMEVCIGLDQPCPLNDQVWKPLQAETVAEYPVDWLGPRSVYAGVQVRDADHQMVPVFLRSDASPRPQVVANLKLSGRINPQTPVAGQPATVQTALAATQAAYPLTGSVLIEGGACCKGGAAGSTINLQVAFSATGKAGAVTQMRVSTSGGCPKDGGSLDAAWEPLVEAKTYPALLAINWVTWAVSVQYRDEQGNLSSVYCDDIALEGGPP